MIMWAMYAVVVFLITLYILEKMQIYLKSVLNRLTPEQMKDTSEVELIIQLYEFKVGTN
jgi:hypothetical protein